MYNPLSHDAARAREDDIRRTWNQPERLLALELRSGRRSRRRTTRQRFTG